MGVGESGSAARGWAYIRGQGRAVSRPVDPREREVEASLLQSSVISFDSSAK